MADTPTSDLIDRVQHEHNHLTRLFDDINVTFETLADGDVEAELRQEIIESAAEDLRIGLEEMLHHFDQEEEVFFVEIERRYPDLAEEIALLVETHEFICERTRALQKYLHLAPDILARRVGEAREIIDMVRSTLAIHTRDENRIFGDALQRMSSAERKELLGEMQKI